MEATSTPMQIHLHLPQVLVLLMLSLDYGITTLERGKREDRIPLEPLATFLTMLSLLYWGGFFS